MKIVSADQAPSLASDALVRAEKTLDTKPTEQTSNTNPFAELFTGAVREASQLDANAGVKMDALAAGKSDDIHGTMIAMKEAEISVKLLGSIRNHLLDAFHEIWRTSV